MNIIVVKILENTENRNGLLILLFKENLIMYLFFIVFIF